MILRFKKVKLVNFGSYAKAEVALCDRGFCLVSGENRYIKDNAISNGSGKSTIWSAICYALTGETINGLTNNLMNINADTDECSVELQFAVNADDYSIMRSYKPKSDLKVLKNGVDISGKGIRESEKVLAENLPDLTKDLIASTIILGQGMPNKFSSFSPSGRKALLEKLTKSDFMVEDIKNRISERQLILSKTIRDYADSILVNETNLESTKKSLAAAEASMAMLQGQDYDAEMALVEAELAEAKKAEEDLSKKIELQEASADEQDKLALEAEDLAAKENSKLDPLNKRLLEANDSKSNQLLELNESYSSSTAQIKNDKYALEMEAKALAAEVAKLRSIKDVCPTCGQKLPKVIKPDTSAQEKELADKQNLIKSADDKLASASAAYSKYKKEIDEAYVKATAATENEMAIIRQNVSSYKAKASLYRSQASAIRMNASQDRTGLSAILRKMTLITEKLTKIKFDKENLAKQKASLEKQIVALSESAKALENAIILSTAAKNDAEEHVNVLKKMLTLTQRDFRGYLLEDIIKYIDAKAKEYCQIVFGTSELNVYLDGNALDISYCGKMFDSLSGGEKQRCDLILQFAIRDLLQNYLNYSSNILVLDEIFDGLDRKSTDKVIELISEKLKDVESTFVISHHSDELELPIDSEIRVIKNENGISEVQ